jgi:O-methyltransferase
VAFGTTELQFPKGSLVKDFVSTSLGNLSHMGSHARKEGGEWPVFALSMIGEQRMNNIRTLLEQAHREGLEGDFMECGVWRGGASIYAKIIIESLEWRVRKPHVWLADSFSGLPLPRSQHDSAIWAKWDYLSVPSSEVKANLINFGVFDNTIHFCEGYFVDSLPLCHPKKIVVLRMDGDMYDSTTDQLSNLFPSVVDGGWIIIDDWSIPSCQKAVLDFWKLHKLQRNFVQIDRACTGARNRLLIAYVLHVTFSQGY